MSDLLSEAPERSAIEDDRKRFRVVAIIGATIALPLAAVHVWQAFLVSSLQSTFSDMGGPLPTISQILINLGHLGLLPVIVVGIDLAIFAVMYVLARRYWVGLLYAPAVAYLALSAVYYLLMVLPVFSVITLVK
jgi:hypothetical protein